jgi:hypothetical protein
MLHIAALLKTSENNMKKMCSANIDLVDCAAK